MRGTLVEQPPAQNVNGGGLNSTFTVNVPDGGLPDGGTLDLQPLLGVEQGGFFRFYINTEAVTSPPPNVPATKNSGTPGKAGRALSRQP